MIIGFSGKLGTGKDTAGLIAQELLQDEKWEIKKYAQKVKEVASLLTGVPFENFEDQEFKKSDMPNEWGEMTVRSFLQRLGTEAIRDQIHPNAWVNALFADYKSHSNWIITDVRFPNEAEAIYKLGGKLFRLENDRVSTNDHPSETALDNFNFHAKIYNNGSKEDLKTILTRVLKDFEVLKIKK